MSGCNRPRRAVERVDYTEPGDDLDLSALSFAETHPDSSVASTVGDSLLVFSPEPSIVEEKAIEMVNARANQLTAELEAIFFQLGEIDEDVNTRLDAMSTNELTKYSVELKDLHVKLVKASQELNLVSSKREYEGRVQQELNSSKEVMNQVKLKLSSRESCKERADASRQQELEALE